MERPDKNRFERDALSRERRGDQVSRRIESIGRPRRRRRARAHTIDSCQRQAGCAVEGNQIGPASITLTVEVFEQHDGDVVANPKSWPPRLHQELAG